MPLATFSLAISIYKSTCCSSKSFIFASQLCIMALESVASIISKSFFISRLVPASPYHLCNTMPAKEFTVKDILLYTGFFCSPGFAVGLKPFLYLLKRDFVYGRGASIFYYHVRPFHNTYVFLGA